ncbi:MULTISPECIES: DUF3077 domain-containing protein [Pseudomonas]|uniref:Protein of uncharacterized function (DUF3077) n=1 Tax=Pseudomonas chlororaphis TaxID=587753 RepID=A0AAX3FZ98_9PSED|nr:MULTISPECIES: DUF3077 domain-containing protein [Pseudomonas]AZC35189.1 hypothetical protein C4K37_0780 [Pseudomonas chlororaphis subsp. piscium]AZC41730.1 hypothetical protein C4K36_0783 [Pseudomonas chlororaphis subsp. piscium]AZC48399.1 hypothetical protein C4K35_0794 [Pseudomonas chlororaphis subsp. piscium]AZC54975.1 hypothetical protein C4K34_0788 [Pseudomonas chlororaphis subsp. piscium]AZC61296.1 hypothetical protein C4K33_0782 [Pseudomonas chlororaphis subsp. piscium]
MKKIISESLIPQPSRALITELESPNRSLLDALQDNASGHPLHQALVETGSTSFGCRDGNGRPLFAVRAGVSAEEALLHVSLLLKCAEETADEITSASGIERGLIWSMIHSVEMARAVVDALLDGTGRRRDVEVG